VKANGSLVQIADYRSIELRFANTSAFNQKHPDKLFSLLVPWAFNFLPAAPEAANEVRAKDALKLLLTIANPDAITRMLIPGFR
jgi:hypothetical protein